MSSFKEKIHEIENASETMLGTKDEGHPHAETFKEMIHEIEDASEKMLGSSDETHPHMDTFKEMIHEIEDASEKMLGSHDKHGDNHLAKELLQDLLDRAMTEEEVQAIEDKYLHHFKEDEILKIIHEAKLAKGFVRD